MTDANTGHPEFDLKRLAKAPAFFRRNRNLFKTYEAFRKQLERRRSNGLAASGAVVDTALGLMVDPTRFRDWLLTPNWRDRVAGQTRPPSATHDIRAA